MNYQVKQLEKKTKPSFSSLPEELVENCLARISKSYYPKLLTVSKNFRSLLTSKELYAARAHLGSTEECLYVYLCDCSSGHVPQWFTLWINPNRTPTKEKKIIAKLLGPILSTNFPSLSHPIAYGSEIYVIGGPVHDEPSSAVCVLDCRSHTWRDAPSMNIARKYAATCVYDGKIYVMGGVKDGSTSPFAEVFDTRTQTWKYLPDPPPFTVNDYCPPIINLSEVKGKIYVWGSKTDYAYDLKQDKWECCNGWTAMVSSSCCIMENVRYSCSATGNGRFMWSWYDIKDQNWKKVEGLDTLNDRRNVDSLRTWPELVSLNGTLLASWKELAKDRTPSDMTKIWCAEIVVEKRDGGEIWGNVKWADVVLTAPAKCPLFRCVGVLL